MSDTKRGIMTDDIPAVKETSISAHIVRSISVNMTMTEMDALVHTLGIAYGELTPGQRQLQAEFVSAVESVRFSTS